jgi:hypothetical protein
MGKFGSQRESADIKTWDDLSFVIASQVLVVEEIIQNLA